MDTFASSHASKVALHPNGISRRAHTRRMRIGFPRRIILIGCLLASLICTASGCFFSTKRVSAPKINASAAADKAMELYDKNGDGSIDKKELEACPGLLAALKVYDTDGNQQISRQEIADRITDWKTTSSAMATVDCRVTLDGRPLGGATVRFVPEPYL